MTDWPGGVAAVTLFAEDLPATKQFYLDVFQLPVIFTDDSSAVFKFGQTLINLLDVSAAPELIQPARVGDPDAQRVVFTLEVDDVDVKCRELEQRGVELLNGPLDRPWGPRTASFRDPAGHIWEIAAEAQS
jgi:catechol 2,3-dioxygenase-like lactoylglutathione lyase family enzyme